MVPKRFGTKNRFVDNVEIVRYSPDKGIYIAHGAVQPNRIQILNISGACQAGYTGVCTGDFSWKPRTRGMYFVRVLAGNSEFVAKVICTQ